jgi:hypothetical protein
MSKLISIVDKIIKWFKKYPVSLFIIGLAFVILLFITIIEDMCKMVLNIYKLINTDILEVVKKRFNKVKINV